ncbi:MAG: glycosyltransferase family 4 protein [Acidobacteriales bacterium]|nr:glycosyltransferase family 4 protein [Terriglobales bacterium]
MRRLAFVVQRYGEGVAGGSEMMCRSIAERLAPHIALDVLTTCAVDYTTWENRFPAGEEMLNGVTVRRFPVARLREWEKLASLSDRVLHQAHSEKDETDWIRAQGPLVPGLFDYLAAHREDYDLFVFFTYLYATTCFGLPLVAGRAILVPTAHDELPIYLAAYDRVFREARDLIFLTPEERHFVLRRFCFEREVGHLVGGGVEFPPDPLPGDPDWDILRARTGDSPVITYVGRVSESKGCVQLIDYFLRYIEDRPESNVKLLLAGKATIDMPAHGSILAPAFISDAVKWLALQASDVVLAPSPYESLCIAALEGWASSKPVLANGRSDVLRGQCVRSQGGLWYRDYREFRACLDKLLSEQALRAQLGRQGRGYVEKHHRWDDVAQRYLAVFEATAAEIAG